LVQALREQVTELAVAVTHLFLETSQRAVVAVVVVLVLTQALTVDQAAAATRREPVGMALPVKGITEVQQHPVVAVAVVAVALLV